MTVRWLTLALAAATAFHSFLAGAIGGSPVAILHVGEFVAADTLPRSGGIWFALVVDSGGAHVQKCMIQVTRKGPVKEVGNPKDGHFHVGLDVRTEPTTDARFVVALIKGIPGRKEGPLKTSAGFPGAVKSGETRTLGAWNGEALRLVASERAIKKRKGFTKGWTQYSLRLTDLSGRRSQELVRMDRWPGAPYPGIYWVGDLDQDGAPDFLMNLNIGEAGARDTTLFLSSAAGKSERVRKVATIHTLGC